MYEVTKSFKDKNGKTISKGEVYELEAIYHNGFEIGRSKVELSQPGDLKYLSITHNKFNECFTEVDS